MAQVDQLLKYQQEDSKLLKIEQEAAASEERKNFIQTKSFLNKASEKLDSLEAKALELKSILEKLNGQYKEISETLNDFENLDELVDGGADISFYKKNVLQLTERLKSIRQEINSLTKSIKDSDEEYQTLKKKVLSAQKQYPEYAEIYKKYKALKEEEMASVKAELEKLGKSIDSEIMARYQAKRSERIFPILCSVKGGRCSKCGTELSLVGKEKIESGSAYECDNCHRFLYKEQ